MAIDTRILYIKQHIPPELWKQARDKAAVKRKTMLEFYIETLQEAVIKGKQGYNKKKINSNFPPELWDNAKALASSQGMNLGEWLTDITKDTVNKEI